MIVPHPGGKKRGRKEAHDRKTPTSQEGKRGVNLFMPRIEEKKDPGGTRQAFRSNDRQMERKKCATGWGEGGPWKEASFVYSAKDTAGERREEGDPCHRSTGEGKRTPCATQQEKGGRTSRIFGRPSEARGGEQLLRNP